MTDEAEPGKPAAEDDDEMAAANAKVVEFIVSIERTQAILRRLMGEPLASQGSDLD